MPVTACTEERTRREPQSVVLSLARDKSTSGNLDVSSVLARSQSQHARRQCAGVQWPGTTTVIAAVLCILCLVVAAKAWDHSYLIIWMKWLQEHEEEGRVLFVLGYAACLLLLLPASLLAVLAGAHHSLLCEASSMQEQLASIVAYLRCRVAALHCLCSADQLRAIYGAAHSSS